MSANMADRPLSPDAAEELNPVDESTPLLGQEVSATQERRQPAAWPVYFTPLAIVIVFAIVADLGGSLIDTPEVRLLEMAVCRDFYRIHNPKVIGPPPLSYVDENLCKLEEIQSNLAYLRATKAMLTVLPGTRHPWAENIARHG
jgi:hypothetical protein